MNEIDFNSVIGLLDCEENTKVIVIVEEHEFNLNESDWRIGCYNSYTSEYDVFSKDSWSILDLASWFMRMLEEKVEPCFSVTDNISWEYKIIGLEFDDDVVTFYTEA